MRSRASHSEWREDADGAWTPYATLSLTLYVITDDGREHATPIELEVNGCGWLGEWTYRVTVTDGEPTVALEAARQWC